MTLGKLFTYWGILGHDFDTDTLYSCTEGKGFGPEKPTTSVKHTIVKAHPWSVIIAHILYRTKVDGSIGAMIKADIHFSDKSNFIPNATLSQLEDYIRTD